MLMHHLQLVTDPQTAGGGACSWRQSPCASTSLKPTVRLPTLRKMALVGMEAAGMWARGTGCLSISQAVLPLGIDQ